MPYPSRVTPTTIPSTISRIAITTGEPAGIGPELVLSLTERDWPVQLVAIGDSGMLAKRAEALGIQVNIQPYSSEAPRTGSTAGILEVEEIALGSDCVAGKLNTGNAESVIQMLERACTGCVAEEFDAMVTAPVHKSIINDAGIPFTGHTEFLGEMTESPVPVMLLVADTLRVALLTTHLPLSAVPENITAARIDATIRILNDGLTGLFQIESPSIAVLGLNPHAGEGGHLGSEEIEIIIPTLDKLRADGVQITGPLPADTAFTHHASGKTDAYLAMYHDQGLPVLKAKGFGHAVNVTLGLPIIRTSVDHGTALCLAATGNADTGSMMAALKLAIELTGTS